MMCTNLQVNWNGYTVLSSGVILNKDKTVKAVKYNKKGYAFSSFYYNGKLKTHLFHSIIANCFLGERPTGYEVDHKDNNRSNNEVSNLQYLTKSANNKKSYDAGNRNVSGINNANSKYSEVQIDKLIYLYESGVKASVLPELTGIKKSSVYKIINKTIKRK